MPIPRLPAHDCQECPSGVPARGSGGRYCCGRRCPLPARRQPSIPVVATRLPPPRPSHPPLPVAGPGSALLAHSNLAVRPCRVGDSARSGGPPSRVCNRYPGGHPAGPEWACSPHSRGAQRRHRRTSSLLPHGSGCGSCSVGGGRCAQLRSPLALGRPAPRSPASWALAAPGWGTVISPVRGRSCARMITSSSVEA